MSDHHPAQDHQTQWPDRAQVEAGALPFSTEGAILEDENR